MASEQEPTPAPEPQPPTHVGGRPNPERLGFVSGNVLLHSAEIIDTPEPTLAIARRLGRAVSLVDADGYDDEIVAAAVDGAGNRFAWLQCRSKEIGHYVDVSFRLHVEIEGRRVIDWEPVTYNPYFGVLPLRFEWLADLLVFRYREKHNVYEARIDRDGKVDLFQSVDGQFIPAAEAAEAERRRWEERQWAGARRTSPNRLLPTWIEVVLAIVAGLALALILVYGLKLR
jgi:hypothetical protein